MPIVQADRLTRIGAALLQGRRRIRRGGPGGRRRLRQRQPRRPRFPRRHRDPDLHRPHQGRPHRARREVDHRAGIADHDRDRRPLGLWLPRQRQGDGTDDREGEDRQCRGLHRVPAKPCRAARRLSADGDARRHDRASPPPIPAARRSMSRRSAAARRGSAPIRSRSRCPPISKRPFYLDMATSAVAAGKIALAVARERGDPDRLDHRRRGTARPPIPRNTARAARCCRSAAPRAIRAAASPRWSRCCAAC